MTAVALKISKNVTSTFFNAVTVFLLPKNLTFEHGTAKLACCLGRHLTSYAPDPDVFKCKIHLLL